MNQKDALNWIAGVFEQSPDSLKPETRREEIPTWDSMGVLMLMAEMDEKFGILMTDADIEAMGIVDDILAVLRKHGKLDTSQ
jgi:acyl carrier protein